MDDSQRPLYSVFDTSWGWTAARFSGRGLQRIVLPRPGKKGAIEAYRRRFGAERCAAGRWAELERQLEEYFSRRRRRFDIPLDITAESPFTAAVLKAVRAIPFGMTETYGSVAVIAGCPAAARAVGRVMSRNPVPPLVPCHRVVAKSGFGGFSGGEGMKERLLDHESAAETSRGGGRKG